MKEMDSEELIDVEAWKQAFMLRKTSKLRFKIPLTAKQYGNILYAAYKVEVETRGRCFTFDEETKNNILKVATFLTAPMPRPGMLFCGNCGNGKTTLLLAIRESIELLIKEDYLPGDYSIKVLDAREVYGLVKDYDLFKRVRCCPVLALEDIGREPTEILDYGNVHNPIIDIIEYRYNFQLYTFITTNLTPKELREKYGKRIADRFNEMVNVIVFRNESYRKM